MDTVNMPPGMNRGTKIAEASMAMPTMNITAAAKRCHLVPIHPSWARAEASHGSSACRSVAIRSNARCS